MKYLPWKIYDFGNGVVAVWKLKRPVGIEPGDSVTVSECEAVNNGLKLELGEKRTVTTIVRTSTGCCACRTPLTSPPRRSGP